MALAADWESDTTIRNVGRQLGGLTKWPDTKSIGVPSMKACSLNSRLLEMTAVWWTQQSEQPAAIPIDMLRMEARMIFQFNPLEKNICLPHPVFILGSL